jgi:SpoVK/Ycf46/Vps4 family AAA+-type ATPase
MGNEESRSRKKQEKNNSIIINQQQQSIPQSTQNITPQNNNINNEVPVTNINNYNINEIPNNNNTSNNICIDVLNKAYSLFMEGNGLVKDFSFQEALFKFDEALRMTTLIYYKIDDEQLKAKVNMFIKNINSQIDFTNYQIKNQYEFKKTAGYATKEENKKVDYLECIRIPSKDSDNFKVVDIRSKKNSDDVKKYDDISTNKSDNFPTKSDKDNKVVTTDLKSRILTEIVDSKPGIKFSDIIGLHQAKQILKEIIVLPNLRPDLFTGLRSPPRGLLLFGPPGVGKTMIAKAVATECECTFFNISSSSLTSKYVGESEKLVRALFDLAYEKQPSVVFVDEIESILSKRTDGDNEASKRLKTEFLIQFDGVGSNQNARVLIIGATNRPHELDSAVLRRLPKRIYIGPFNQEERKLFIQSIMSKNENMLIEEEYDYIGQLTNMYSNSDLKELCREAAYEPIREITDLSTFHGINKLRPTIYNDFVKAIKKVRGTLNDEMLKELETWNETLGAIS